MIVSDTNFDSSYVGHASYETVPTCPSTDQISKDEMLDVAMAHENVQNFVTGKEIVKTIAVPGKLVNIVVK